jgi:hypothetical protein
MYKKLYKNAKEFIDKHERYLSPLAMAIGFTIDSLTLQRIDLKIENIVIITYFSIAIFSILYLNLFRKKQYKQRFLIWLNLVLPLVLQIAFGGLFSVFMVFYSRSSSLFVSWPFLLILFSLLTGNEIFRKRYERLTFHLSILYISLFAYAVFAVPVLLGRIDVDVFLASGGISLLLILVIILILHRIDHKTVKKNKESLLVSILSIYFLFNFLYLTNLIPPIPLAMKAGGVYHNVTRDGANYKLTFEKPKWYKFWRETAHLFHHKAGSRVYVFSSIFAPAKFNQQIFHQWSYYDKKQKEWIKRDKLSFSISGGRDGGYRGYSYKSALTPGDWRVDVMTHRGQILGRIKFEIIKESESYKLEERINN